MTPLVIRIPGKPTAWARAGQHGRIKYTPKKQAVAMDVIRLAANRVMAGKTVLSGPLSVSALFVYAWPASWSEKKRRAAGAHWKTSPPDSDNLIKLCADSLNGLVWIDDAIIARAVIEKQYGVTPATIIRVEPLTAAEGEQT